MLSLFCWVFFVWGLLVGFFTPCQILEKTSLVWAKEESKTCELKLLRTPMEKYMLGSDMKNCLIIIYSCFCERITSGVIVIFLFLRHQFVENNLILKMGPVDKRKVRVFLRFL